MSVGSRAPVAPPGSPIGNLSRGRQLCGNSQACYHKFKAMERSLRRPVQSQSAYAQRKRILVWGMLLALLLAAALAALLLGCSGATKRFGGSTTTSSVFGEGQG